MFNNNNNNNYYGYSSNLVGAAAAKYKGKGKVPGVAVTAAGNNYCTLKWEGDIDTWNRRAHSNHNSRCIPDQRGFGSCGWWWWWK